MPPQSAGATNPQNVDARVFLCTLLEQMHTRTATKTCQATLANMTTAATWQQTSLVDDLLTTIENNPTSIDARKLLIEQYEALGWDDAAASEAKSIIELFPNAPETTELLSRYGEKATSKPKSKQKSKQPHKVKKSTDSTKHSALDVQQLGVEYIILQDDAKSLLRELTVLSDLAPELDLKDRVAELTALSEGRVFSAARGKAGSASAAGKDGGLRSARAVAASIKADQKKAMDVAILDLEAVLDRTSAAGQSSRDKDALREGLRKRADAVKSALPADLAHIASDALMHIEHEKLAKTYQNSETMLGDPVTDIPRADFWVSEDGYAWDIDELVQAVQAAKGAMRNPLTKEPFSTSDVVAIIRHPKGKVLAALEVEQNQLKKGVRKETISMLKTLSETLLLDMSENSQPSHEAVDAWLLYVATLPRAEQEAVDKLRVAAKDSHSGQPFDDTVGDAVRDAKANRLCFHKAGDFLSQAAVFLGKM